MSFHNPDPERARRQSEELNRYMDSRVKEHPEMTEEQRRIIEPYEAVAHEREVIMADQREEIRKLEARIAELKKLAIASFYAGVTYAKCIYVGNPSDAIGFDQWSVQQAPLQS